MSFLRNIRVGFYLAVRQVRRANLWTNILIIFIMLLTFLNLVLVTGFLVGIVTGISDQYRNQQTGDIILRSLDTKNYIQNSPEVISFLHTLPQIKALTARYVTAGTLEANYLTRVGPNEKPNQTGATIEGINPEAENAFSHLARYVHEGRYLTVGDYDRVLLGPQFIHRYSFGDQPGLTPLDNVYPGTKIRLTINGHTREVTVVGILKVPANSSLAARAFMIASEVRQLLGRSDYSVNQIALLLRPGVDPTTFRNFLERSGLGSVAKIQTFEQAMPSGVADVRNTFGVIGNAIGSIGLTVASITIFIVIFINAVTRRKFIGILKGIGISGEAIEISYIFQAFFYAIIGSGIGLAVLYGFLVPYVSAHPISLPVSDAIIVAPVGGTMIRVFLLALAAVIAGYIPARMIVRKNTLDSILGRA